MKVFGITGGIACGKSTIVDFLQRAVKDEGCTKNRKGVEPKAESKQQRTNIASSVRIIVIDGDSLPRSVQQPNSAVVRRIAEEWPDTVDSTTGALDRIRLGSKVFGDTPAHVTARRKLNAIMRWPLIRSIFSALFSVWWSSVVMRRVRIIMSSFSFLLRRGENTKSRQAAVEDNATTEENATQSHEEVIVLLDLPLLLDIRTPPLRLPIPSWLHRSSRSRRHQNDKNEIHRRTAGDGHAARPSAVAPTFSSHIQVLPAVCPGALLVSAVVVVDCDRDVQLARLQRRNNWTLAEAEARIASQIPSDVRRSQAHYIIDNSHDDSTTAQQLSSDSRTGIRSPSSGDDDSSFPLSTPSPSAPLAQSAHELLRWMLAYNTAFNGWNRLLGTALVVTAASCAMTVGCVKKFLFTEF